MRKIFCTATLRLAIVNLAILTFASPWVQQSVDAQMFGMPAPSNSDAWTEIISCLPEKEPIACSVWNESGALNPEGNHSDQWYANPDIQKALGKLKTAIATLAKEQGPETLARLAEDVGWKVLSKAGVVYLEDVFLEQQSANAALILRLGDDEESIKTLLMDAMKEAGVEPTPVGSGIAFEIPEVDVPIVIGIHSGFFVGAIGEGNWKTTVDRILSSESAPEWVSERLSATDFERRSQFSFANIESMMALIPEQVKAEPEFARIYKLLGLDGMKSISLGNGADRSSNISKIHLECDKTGLTSIFDVPAIDTKKLNEIPGDAISAVAIRFSPENVLQLVQGSVPEEQFNQAVTELAERTGLDLEKDIIDHLEGSIRFYQSGMIISPKQVGIVKIKNEATFDETLKRVNELMMDLAESQGLEFVEQEKNGLKTYGIKAPVISAYWAVFKGELYISTASRAIGSHIRKASKPGKQSVMEAELTAKILADAKSSGLEGPIAMQYYDLDQITETVVPLIQGAFAFIPPEAAEMFDFGSEDFPPIEALLGLRPTGGMMFKSKSGYTLISRYDTPIPLDLSSVALSGVAVGMLLPAVQQVREAARRTQSMNNQRQLALSLLNYEAANGSLPPAYTVDADGNPLLSWRVAILPYFDQQELYDKFHHDEPWDSEHNIKLLDEMPLMFSNPSSLPQGKGYTDYVAPVGEDSILMPGVGMTLDAITDGLSNTVMVMEVGSSQQVPWTSPQDIDVTTLADLNLDNGHPATVIVTLGDGSVHAIPKTTPLESFFGIINKSDGIDASEVLGW